MLADVHGDRLALDLVKGLDQRPVRLGHGHPADDIGIEPDVELKPGVIAVVLDEVDRRRHGLGVLADEVLELKEPGAWDEVVGRVGDGLEDAERCRMRLEVA